MLLPLPVMSTNSASAWHPNRRQPRAVDIIFALHAILFVGCIIAGIGFLVFEIVDNIEAIEAVIRQVVEFVSQVITVMIFLAFFASFCCR